jgi:hypothetical protein
MHICRAHPDGRVLGDHLEVPGLGFLPVNAFVIHAAPGHRGTPLTAAGRPADHTIAEPHHPAVSGDQMMFLDCPAYLDQEGTVRCGLPAEVTHHAMKPPHPAETNTAPT